MPSYLAFYCDSLLKDPTTTDLTSINEAGEQIGGFLRCIVSKDLFASVYSQYMQDRLLLARGQDRARQVEAESRILKCIEKEVGSVMVASMKAMIYDIQLDDGLRQDFKESK